MKTTPWIHFAAIGALCSGVATRAEEKANFIATALSATTISGYVDTSAVWNPGSGNAHPAPFAFNAGKQDGFNLDVVDLKVAKPLTDGQWSAGYTVELMFGPDASAVTGETDQELRQAFVILRVPLVNGIDFSFGRWDSTLGYESTDSYKNPNWTRSYGYTLEPTEHTGLLAFYKFSESISASVGVANTVTTGPINEKSPRAESKKAVITSLTLTAPENWGLLAGDALYAAVDHGPGGTNSDRTQVYIGTTFETPITNLSFGAALDSINHTDVGGVDFGYAMAVAGYARYKATEKVTAFGRVEYGHGPALGAGVVPLDKVLALTGTLQYDVWQNVVSRVEARWDHAANGQNAFGGTDPLLPPTRKNELMFAANIIYKF